MAWTDARIDALKRMWQSGFSASLIAEELGEVTRNAVIGKAHRLGLLPTSAVTAPMLRKIVDLPLTVRTQRIIANQNMIYIGDLVQHTEAELLRIPDFGRKSLQDVKGALSELGLRLGVMLINWPPEDIEKAAEYWDVAQKASQLQQARGGATFQPVDDHFSMIVEGDGSDLAAALKPITQQMQTALLQKARSFSAIAARLDNQPGWSGIGRTTSALADWQLYT